MNSLNIQNLTLHDFRCFQRLEIDFHERLTVLIAANGAGKTAILDAIAVAFGPYVGAFDESVGRHFKPTDIRMAAFRATESNEIEFARNGARLEATGWIPGSLEHGIGLPSKWKRSLSGPVKAKTTIRDAKDLIAYGKRQQAAVRSPNTSTVLPLLAYYGTGRLWQQKKLTSAKLPRTSRTIGYADCLDPASSYKSFVSWFRYWNTNTLKAQLDAIRTRSSYVLTEFDRYIESVSGAVNTCLAPSGWHSIEYSLAREELVASHAAHGTLPVDLLSDGIRNMIGMVADIAFRATKLNPHLGGGAARETPGIVLIDEVDMHLHPAWQQLVLSGLANAFPEIQLIVTTHSPQVLSTVKRENVRVVGTNPNGEGVASVPLAMTYGEPSGDVLQSVMMVDPQPPVSEKPDLHQLTEWVDQGEFNSDRATRLMRKLEHALGVQHPQLRRLQRSIYRQNALKS